MFSSMRKNTTNAKLVDSLAEIGIIKSNKVIECMKKVDRFHYSAIKSEAYEDRPHPIGYNVTISAPHMHVNRMLSFKHFSFIPHSLLG